MPSRVIFFVICGFVVTIEGKHDIAARKTQANEEMEARMIGGEEELDHPFMASINEFNDQRWTATCLGTIISKHWILTSGLCVVGMRLEWVFIDVGAHYMNQRTTYSSQHTVNGIMVHPDYNTNTGQNDVALLMLNEPISYIPRVQSIHLGRLGYENGTKVVSIGWGLEGNGEDRAEVFSALQLSTLATSVCQEMLARDNLSFDETIQICVFGGEGKDMCRMDEGAPLLAFWEKAMFIMQVGIFSNVFKHARRNCSQSNAHPLIFTRVSAYFRWINQVTNLNLRLV